MLRGNKNKMLIITTLCCVLVFMGVGYAVLSAQLDFFGEVNFSGVWDIRITDMKVLSKKGMAKEGNISYEGINASFSHELYAPGDSITYEVTVTNEGNIKAALKQVTSTVTPKYDKINLTNDLYQGQVLNPGESMSFTIKSEFDISAISLPTDKIAPVYNIEIIYYQYSGNEIITPPDFETDNVCFTVSDDGTLDQYDYSCGLDVIVPATVNGKPVTKLSGKSFNSPEYLYEKGFAPFKEVRVYNKYLTSDEYYYFVEDEKTKNQLIEWYLGSDPKEAIIGGTYFYFVIGDLEDEVYSYHTEWITGFYSSGEEAWEVPDYLMYWCRDDETGNEYFIITEEEAYDAAIIYLESYDYVDPPLYVAGDPNIPYDYRTKIPDVIEEGDISLYYINDSEIIESASYYVESLDLSNAIYLETISTTNFNNLKSLSLPQNGVLHTIQGSSFRNAKLNSLTIPSTVTSIGAYAFYSMPKGSIIKIKRINSVGLSLGQKWNGNATISYVG